jgi:ketopantoate reductase
MKLLIYGTGVLGSLYAARLHAAGHTVTLLARGQRLVDLLAGTSTDQVIASSMLRLSRWTVGASCPTRP